MAHRSDKVIAFICYAKKNAILIKVTAYIRLSIHFIISCFHSDTVTSCADKNSDVSKSAADNEDRNNIKQVCFITTLICITIYVTM